MPESLKDKEIIAKTSQWRVVEKSVEEILASRKPVFKLETSTYENSSVSVCAERGGTISSLILNGEEIFYNDPDLRNNITKNVREWFWMWPVAGNLSQEDQEKITSNLKQHGFLRNVVWGVIENNNGKIVLEYENSPEKSTFEQFPYHIKIKQSIEISKSRAYFNLYIQNLDSKMAPFAPWHHTYYQVNPEDKGNLELKWVNLSEEDRLAWINGDKTIRIKNPWSVWLNIPWKNYRHIEYGKEFGEIWLRSEKDKWFVCIEPVIAHGSEFNQKAIQIEPWETEKVSFEIQRRA